MFSASFRLLIYLVGLGYGVLGAALFLAPDWASGHFAWKVSPLVAATIGGWCLGNAYLAFVTARRAQWSVVYASVSYLALFGLFEAWVVWSFRPRLIMSNPLTWLYLGTLAANVAMAAYGVIDFVRQPKSSVRSTIPMTPIWRVYAVAFIALVGFLGLYGIMTQTGGQSRSIFPEPLSPFNLRSFGAFYLALALSVTPLIFTRRLNPVLHHGFASYGLIVIITIAGLRYLHLFDFVQRPLGLLYFGAYVAVGAVVLFVLLKRGTG